jgi:hypothetical protein
MSPRPLSRDELQALGLGDAAIKAILRKQAEKRRNPNRKYKYIVFLTTQQAEKLATETGEPFYRAVKYTPSLRKGSSKRTGHSRKTVP